MDLSKHETVIQGKTRWKSMRQFSGQTQIVNIKGLIIISILMIIFYIYL